MSEIKNRKLMEFIEANLKVNTNASSYSINAWELSNMIHDEFIVQRERLNEETDNYCHCGDKGIYTDTSKCGVCGKQNII